MQSRIQSIYYTVVENYDGTITVNSFGGKDKKQEQKFALSMYRKVYGVFYTYGEASRLVSELKGGEK